MDPLTIMGIAANAMQIVAFSAEVVGRLKWCLDQKEHAPRLLEEIQMTLPVLTETVTQAKKNAELPATTTETQAAMEERNKNLFYLLQGCNGQIQKLKVVIDKVLPEPGAPVGAAIWHALVGMSKDSKIERINARINKYVEIISRHQTLTAAGFTISQLLQDSSLLQQIDKKVATKVQVDELKGLLGRVEQQQQGQPKQISDEIKTLLEPLQLDMKNQLGYQEIKPILDTILGKLDEQEEKKAEHQREELVRLLHDNIPNIKATDFVERKGIMEQIRGRIAALTRDDRVMVLKGMGGNGKTQLTWAICKEQLASGRFKAVFWLNATSESSVKRSFQEISENLTKGSRQFVDINERISFVKRTLESWTSEFLIVFDNYDDPSAFEEHDLRFYMPDAEKSRFLVTTRLPQSKIEVICASSFVIDVLGMTPAEAVELLYKRAGREQPKKAPPEAEDIVKRLGYHPLAIHLSGAYISKRKTLKLDGFLRHFEDRKDLIINKPPSGLSNYQRPLDKQEKATSLAVFTSWELSYKLLEPETEEGKLKATLLELLAFLHNQGVSEKVFLAQAPSLRKEDRPKWLKSYLIDDEWSHYAFEDAIADLRELSLISDYSETEDEEMIDSITLHPLVRDWVILRLTSQQRTKYAIEATNIVHRFIASYKNPVAAFEMTLPLKSEALSYVTVCEEHLSKYCSPKSTGAVRLGEGLLSDAGEIFALFYEYMGKVTEAHIIFDRLIKWREKNLPKTDKALLRAKSLFTEVLRLQKDFNRAKEIDRGVYEVRLSLLRSDQRLDDGTLLDEDALWSAHDLGWDLEALGDVEKAEELQRIAYNGRLKVKGAEDILTLQSINNLAHTLRRQGKTLEALKLMQRTLDIGEKVFSPHHSELIQFLSNLQDVLRFQGNLEEAEKMARRSLKATEDEWGRDHLKAAASRGQLKDILWDRGKAEEAERTARDNLHIMENSPYSTDISRIDDIALLLDTLSGRQMTDGGSKRKDILDYAEKAIKLVKGLSPESLKLPSVLQDLIYLGTGLEVLRAFKELTELEPIIFKSCLDVFGIADRNSVNSLVRWSSALRMQGRTAEANERCQEVIDRLVKQLAEGDSQGGKSTHLAALSWLAVLYKHTDNRREAMEVYDRAFDYVNRDNGIFIRTADYETLYAIQGLAEDIDDQRRCQKAEILHLAVLESRKEKYKEHPCVDDSLYAYSWNLRLQDRLTEAEKVCQDALKLARNFRGPHRNTMCILKRLAYLEEQLGKHEAAEAHYREVLDGFRRLGTRHVTRVTEALEDLQELLMEQRKWIEARDLIADAIKRRSNGWDQNRGHHAGLIRHLAIVTWELGDGVEGLRLYRKARKTYEEAWCLRDMKDGPQKLNLIRRINELLPGTENMEEEMKIEKAESEAAAAQKIANDASAKKNADVDAADDGQKTPTPQADTPKQTVKVDLKAGLEQVSQSLASHGATQVTYDGTTNEYQTSTKSNEEATANYDAPDVSISRSSTLDVNSFPGAPGNEPNKLDNQDPTALADIMRQMEQASLNPA